jgi:hypothetical protein
MKKILIFCLLLFIFPNKAIAADFSITCSPSGCSSPATAIINRSDIAPNDFIAKSFQVKNNHHETLNLDMTTTKNNLTDDIFLDVVNVIVTGLGGRIRFNDSLRQFLNQPSIDLGSLNASALEQVNITFTFQPVDNQFQNKQAKFDIPVHIDIQGRGGVGSSDSGDNGWYTASTNTITKQSFFPFQTGFVAGASFIPKPTILGESIPPTPSQTPDPNVSKTKLFFKWWYWLFFLAPIFWWFRLLYIRRRSG